MNLTLEVRLTNGQTFEHLQRFPDDPGQFSSEYTEFLDYLKVILGQIVPGAKAISRQYPLVLVNPTAFYNVDHVARVGWSWAEAPEEVEAEIRQREHGFLAALGRND